MDGAHGETAESGVCGMQQMRIRSSSATAMTTSSSANSEEYSLRAHFLRSFCARGAARIEGSKRRVKSSHVIWPRHGCSCATTEVRPKRLCARSQVGAPRARSRARRRAPGAHPGQRQTHGAVTRWSLGQHPFPALRQDSRHAEPEAPARGSTRVLAAIPDRHVDLVVVVGALLVLCEHKQTCQFLAVDGFY